MRECPCTPPVESNNPRKAGQCVICGFKLSPNWICSTEHVQEFFGWLEYGLPGSEGWLPAFQELCERRELDGRERFKLAYLTRDNAAEAAEEAADGVLYCLLDVLKGRREKADEGADAPLTNAAWHFALAFRDLQVARAKRRGSP